MTRKVMKVLSGKGIRLLSPRSPHRCKKRICGGGGGGVGCGGGGGGFWGLRNTINMLREGPCGRICKYFLTVAEKGGGLIKSGAWEGGMANIYKEEKIKVSLLGAKRERGVGRTGNLNEKIRRGVTKGAQSTIGGTRGSQEGLGDEKEKELHTHRGIDSSNEEH